MKHTIAMSIICLFVVACTSAIPNAQSIIPSPAPSILTSPIPPPVPSSTPQQPVPTDPSLPAIDRVINLGTNHLYFPQHPIALDDQHRRLYVSLSAFRTIVLDAETLTKIGEVPFGGEVSVYPESDRLYIGIPGHCLNSRCSTLRRWHCAAVRLLATRPVLHPTRCPIRRRESYTSCTRVSISPMRTR